MINKFEVKNNQSETTIHLIAIIFHAILPAVFILAASSFASAQRPTATPTTAVELLPHVMKEHNVAAVSIGFALGVAAMLGIKKLTGEESEKAETVESGDTIETDGTGETVSSAMLFAVGVDILIDGFLLGLGFVAGAKEGKLLALALTMELLSLGLALASTLRKANMPKAKTIAIVAGLGGLILVGSVAGATVLQQFSKGVIETVLSFGLAALLFLVTEELLVEAHEVPETPLITASFFAGFLLFLILGMIA